MEDSIEQPVVRQFQGCDEKRFVSISERKTQLEKSRAKDVFFYFGSDGGFMIPVRSKLGHTMRMHFERLVSWYGRKQLIPVYIEDNIFNFYMSKEVKSEQFSAAGKRLWQSIALVSPTKTGPRSGCSQSKNESQESCESRETRTSRFRTCCLQKLVCCLCRRSRSCWTTSN